VKKEIVRTPVERQYAEAYELHYTSKDLHSALLFYKEIIASSPDSKEAGYSRSQIQNIIRDVVPRNVLYSTQLNLAMTYVQHEDTKDK
jgi:hypothetical protein